jgi:PilZ domain-containing protein
LNLMGDSPLRSGRVKVALPIQVRGMSAQNKFFEENTQTLVLSKTEVTTQLHSLPDLEMDIHLTSLRSGVSGTFRVVWVNTRTENGLYSVGLELVEPEGDLWQMEFPRLTAEENGAAPPVWIECGRCHERVLTMVVEAEEEFLREGFQISRPCDQCKATTKWELLFDANQPAFDPEALGFVAVAIEEEKIPWNKLHEDQRIKGRARIKLPIKVIRRISGAPIEDISETKNVSRGGAYFLSNQNYEAGELVEVVLPYNEGEAGIPVKARVIRQEEIPGSFYKGIAIRLEEGKK